MIVDMPPTALFLERVGKHVFTQPSSVWGYLPQLNEWGGIHLVWETERVGGPDHVPHFRAVPVCEYILYHRLCSVADHRSCQDREERLEVFAAMGTSNKVAKEESARLMATSGHCVRGDSPLLRAAYTEQT